MSVVALIVGILSIPLAGIFGMIGPAEGADEEVVLKVGFMQMVDNLNPNVGLSDAAYVYYGLVYDALHTVQDDFVTEGNLATSWRMVPADDPELIASGEPLGSVWEYDITEDAYWHDGQPLTVDDVVFTFNLNIFEYDSFWAYQPYAYFMQYAEAIDENTIRIHYYDRETEEPLPCAYAHLICIPILPKHKLQSMDPFDIAFNWQGVFDGEEYPVVGTGPFTATEYMYDEWNSGDHITLVKNPNYHGGSDDDWEVSFDKLIMYFYDDDVAMATDLRTGQLDIAQFPPQTYLAIKEDVEDDKLQNVETFDGIKCTQYWTEIGINMNEAGNNLARLDPAVRQAMAMATNKTYITNNYYAGLAEEGTTLISPVNTDWHYEPTEDELYTFDKAAAEQILEDAGYRYDGGDYREVMTDSMAYDEGWCLEGRELVFNMLIRRENPEEKEIAEYLQQVYEEVGIGLVISIVDEVTLSSEVYGYKYDTMIWYWSADSDPNYMLFCQAGKSINGWNDNFYDNASYNEAYYNSVITLDSEQRKVYTDECQRVNYLDAAYIILAYPYQTYAWRTDKFTNWGDWEEKPCLSFDHFWTGPQLMFEIEPLSIDDDDTPVDEPNDNAWIMYAGIGGAIALVAIVLAVLMLRKKDGGKKDKSDDSKSPLGE